MSTEIVVGLIGLGGALVGALAAFLGIVYQQREQAKNAKQQRLNAMSERAVDALIADLMIVLTDNRCTYVPRGRSRTRPDARGSQVTHILIA